MPDDSLDIFVRVKSDISEAAPAVGVINDASKATEHLVETSEAAHSKLLHAGSGARELHRALHLVTEESPVMGLAMQSAISPIGAAIMVGVLAFRSITKEIEESEKAMEEMGEQATKPLSHRVEALRDGVVSAGVGMEQFRGKLEDAVRGERTLAQSLNDTNTAFKNQITEAENLGEAQKDNELSRAELLHAAGVTSTEEYESQKFEIEKKYAQKKRELEEQLMTIEILAKKSAVSHAEADQPELNTKAKESLKKYEAAAVNAKTVSLDNKQVEEDRAENKKAREEMAKKLGEEESERFRKIGATESNPEAALWNTGKYSNAGIEGATERYNQWAALEQRREVLEKSYRQGPGKEAAAEIEKERAKSEADRASKHAIENQAFTTEGNREVKIKTAERDARVEAEREQAPVKNDTLANQKAAEAEKFVRDPFGRADIIGSHLNESSQQQQKADSELREFLKNNGMRNDQIIKFLKDMHSVNLSFADKLSELDNVVGQIQSRLDHSRIN